MIFSLLKVFLLLNNFTLLKKIKNITKPSIVKLEEKLVEVSLKNKHLTLELQNIKNQNNLLLNKLVHNLKNPVGASFSFSEILIENTEGFDAEKTKKYLNVIKDSSQHAINILNSVAKLNSVKSSNFELNITSENYSEFLTEIIEYSKNKYTKNLINFNLNIEENIFLPFDKIELKFVIDQLINNSVRFSYSNPHISIKVEKIATKVVTTITDNGIGFETQLNSTPFDNFYIENTYDTNQSKCLGLGLTIVKKIIDLHKGSIEILNEKSAGTTVKLHLPI